MFILEQQMPMTYRGRSGIHMAFKQTLDIYESHLVEGELLQVSALSCPTPYPCDSKCLESCFPRDGVQIPNSVDGLHTLSFDLLSSVTSHNGYFLSCKMSSGPGAS